MGQIERAIISCAVSTFSTAADASPAPPPLACGPPPADPGGGAVADAASPVVMVIYPSDSDGRWKKVTLRRRCDLLMDAGPPWYPFSKAKGRVCDGLGALTELLGCK